MNKVTRLLTTCALATTLLSGAEALGAPPKLGLSTQRFRLRNGLDVVLHADPRAAKAVVTVLYRVGSADERPDMTGVAHLFEHLMFMGTRRLPHKQIDLIIEREGGWNNAYTGPDTTVYYDVGPPRLLDTLLWIEADRMASLPAALTESKLDLQREVVLNEYHQSYTNAPYGLAHLALPSLVFPRSHPYGWPVIGNPRHLRAASVPLLQRWFRRYYSPQNACLVVAGRFDAEHVRRQTSRYFGWIPAAPPPSRPSANTPSPLRAVRRRLSDRVNMPKMWMAWRSSAAYAPGDAEMDLLANVLTVGKRSRLYRELVYARRLALDVTAYQDSRRLGSVFVVNVTARPQADIAEIERLTDQILQRIVASPVSMDELERARARIETDIFTRLQRVQDRADRIARYMALLDKPDALADDLARYQRATPTTLHHAAKQTLRPDRRLVLWVTPRGQP